MTHTILICLTPSGHRIHATGVDSHRVASAVRLAGRDHERIRAYVLEAVGVRPTVTEQCAAPEPPPSGPMLAGED